MTTLLYAPQNAQACRTVDEAVAHREAVLEPKLDGWRLIAATDADGEVQCWTRSGTEVTGKIPEIEEEIAAFVAPGSVLDGEVVAFTRSEDGIVHSWGKVQSVLGASREKAVRRSHALTYVVFDLIAYDGINCQALPLHQRRELLEELMDGRLDLGSSVLMIPQMPATEEAYSTLLARGYEGGIVKWLDAPYASGQRGRGWYKLKATATIDAVVTGFKPGKGDFSGLAGAVLFGQYDDDGVLVERGKCSGMNMATRISMTTEPERYIGSVIEISHMGVTDHGRLRHPQFKRLRPDRDPLSVTVHDN